LIILASNFILAFEPEFRKVMSKKKIIILSYFVILIATLINKKIPRYKIQFPNKFQNSNFRIIFDYFGNWKLFLGNLRNLCL